jgi:hypothetical protein
LVAWTFLRSKWVKTSVGILFRGIGRIQRAKKAHVDWMLAVFVAVQAEHNACCFLAV